MASRALTLCEEYQVNLFEIQEKNNYSDMVNLYRVIRLKCVLKTIVTEREAHELTTKFPTVGTVPIQYNRLYHLRVCIVLIDINDIITHLVNVSECIFSARSILTSQFIYFPLFYDYKGIVKKMKFLTLYLKFCKKQCQFFCGE